MATFRTRPRTRQTERWYGRLLRRLAAHVGTIVEGFPPGDVAAIPSIRAILEQYSVTLTDWARSTASRMISEVNQSDEAAWRANANAMSSSLRQVVRTAPAGRAMAALLAEQVTLITSIPLEAAERVHRLTVEGLETSVRPAEIAKEILRTSEVTKSRATLIARTEVARTASVLTQARAEHVGATHYVWRTSGDVDVRPSHQAMEGKVIAWSDTPTLSDGTKTHAGQIFNCRCWPEVIIPENL